MDLVGNVLKAAGGDVSVLFGSPEIGAVGRCAALESRS